MAPKNKFTREEMIAGALRVVQKYGIDKLTAKTMAEELGVSTQPIFTCFGTMDTVRREVHSAAEKIYHKYSAMGLREKIPFLGFGKQYISFARQEPELYRLLFMLPKTDEKNDVIEAMENSQNIVRPSLQKIYNISSEDADRYFRDMWLVVHSIATLIVTDSCPYSNEEIGKILTGFSISLCKAIKEIPGFTSGNFDRDAIFRKLTEDI